MGAKATTYAELIAKTNPGFQYLAIFTVGERVTTWTATGGLYTNTWQADVEQRPLVHNERVVSAVTFGKQDGNDATATALTPVTSIALVDATDDSWFFDPTTSIVYVRLASAADPNDQNGFIVFPLRFCTADPWTAGKTFQDTFTGNVYYPLICATPSTDKAIDFGFAPAVNTGGGVIALDNADGLLDYVWDQYVWNFGNVSVLHGGDDLPFAEYQTIFTGSIDSPTWNDLTIEFRCLDPVDPLNTTIYGNRIGAADVSNSVTYTGNGTRGYGYSSGAGSNMNTFSIAATGTVAAAGGACSQVVTLTRPKPLVFGQQRGVPGVVISQYLGATYQAAIVCVSDQPYKALSAVYVGGSSTGVSWWTATNGYVAVMITLSASTARAITEPILFDFDATELSAGVLMENPADIITAIVEKSYADVTVKTSLISSTDATALVPFTGSYGTPPTSPPFSSGAPFADLAAYWASFGTIYASPLSKPQIPDWFSVYNLYYPFGAASIPIGSSRPITNGTYTDYPIQEWARDTVATSDKRATGASIGGVVQAWYFSLVIVCFGDKVVSVSNIKINGSASNVTWKLNADKGLALVWLWGSTTNTLPASISTITASFTAANSPTAPTAPAGPVIAADNDALAASKTATTGMAIKLAIRAEAPLRDVLVAICRDTMAAVYTSNTGLVRYEAYTPTTADEVDLDEALGDFIVSPAVTDPSERCYRSVTVEYGFDGRLEDADDGGAFTQTSYTDASSVGVLTGRVIDWPVAGSLHATEPSALILARRLAWLMSQGAPVYVVRTTARLFSLDLMSRVRLSRSRLPTAAGDGYVHGFVTRMRRMPASNELELEITENKIADRLGSW